VPTYLVERYWPGVTTPLLLEALKRSQQVIEETGVEGTPVRHVSCTLIPDEEVVFWVYPGPSAKCNMVQQLNERAGIPFIRIIEAIDPDVNRTTR
jgi:hypothetical protein